MAWIECEESHLYDNDEHDVCPHCVQAKPKPKGTVVYNPPAGEVEEKSEDEAKGGKKTVVKLKGKGAGDGFDPVVGWLICVSGASKGQDYKILTGSNTIGRAESMSISIPSDETISRENHAEVHYDAKSKKFNLVKGTGRNTVYVNETALLQPTELNAYDLIELGDSQFRFIPFCGDQFSW